MVGVGRQVEGRANELQQKGNDSYSTRNRGECCHSSRRHMCFAPFRFRAIGSEHYTGDRAQPLGIGGSSTRVTVRCKVGEAQGRGESDADDEDMDAESDEAREQCVRCHCQRFDCTRHSATPTGCRAYGNPFYDRRRPGHSEHARTRAGVGCRDAQSFDIQDSGIHDTDMGCVGRAGRDARAEYGGWRAITPRRRFAGPGACS
jgi:hypothetical protein